MSLTDQYLAYAEAFEESYVDDDWSRIGRYFTDDAEYTGEPHARGREAVVQKLKGAVDGFDRLMDSRTPKFDAPTQSGNTVSVRWKVTYSKAGAPDLVVSGAEIAEFEGEQIRRLTDIFDPAAEQSMNDWMAAHGALLQGA